MAATNLQNRDPGTPASARRHKLVGLAFLAVPMTLFAVFSVAEGIGLEPGWWGHLLQLAAALLLAAGAWARPSIGGPALIVVGAAFGVLLLLTDQELSGKFAALGIVVAPLLVSGVFFTLAGRVARSTTRR
jgi:hypothetical protein